jgi:hypothetical protein
MVRVGANAVRREDCPTEALQVALVYNGHTHHDAHGRSILVSSGLSKELDDKTEPGVIAMFGNLLAALTRRFVVSAVDGVVLVDREELGRIRREPNGICVTASRRKLGLAGSVAPPWDVHLGRKLATTWWGVGCRTFGAHSSELEWGICAAVALRWAESLGETADARNVRARYSQLARLPKWRDKLWSARGYVMPAAAARFALKVEERVEDPAFSELLRRLTATTWGGVVASERVLEELNVRVT